MSSAITPPRLDFTSNAYLTIYLSPSSTYLADLASLSYIHPALSYVGPVGVMKDVQILGVQKPEWNQAQDDILIALRGKLGEGIERVEVQEEPKPRTKRNEF
ncbi:hypothetical protein M422DRAFT_783421 [Sphaerobolus stellatus SS14]|uniref:Uncharacterized protein n=1 Tax=Sphaerobolus stellatus (strain SS14) TaxID=990650 RepID=A0A0C9V4Q5_SPHS4|nr:hypothetical protein M422DRAFT_783421 [Sphaerobolus stellatus SS14]